MEKDTLSRPDCIPVWEFTEMNFRHFGPNSVPVEFANSSPRFHINRLQGITNKIAFPLPPHRKPVYDFIFVTKGSTIRGKALTKYTVEPNQFFFLPAFQITSHKFMSDDIEGYFCHFNLDIFNELTTPQQLLRKFAFLRFIGNPLIKINETVENNVLFLMRRLERLLNNKNGVRLDLAAGYLVALFSEIANHAVVNEIEQSDTALKITENYKDALSRHIYNLQLVSDYADQLNITPNHLNKCVKRTMGISAQDLLNRMLILEAKALLKQTDLQVKEIAFQLSQKNHSDFSRFFKSKTGMTPKEYRSSKS